MTTSMSVFNRYCLNAAALVLSGVSITFTVLLWSSLPAERWAGIMTGIAGLALEVCKFVLIPTSFILLKQKRLTLGFLSLLFGSLLFVVSIGASVGFLENSEQKQQKQSAVWIQRQASITSIDEQIATLQRNADNDTRNGFRARALETMDRINVLRDDKKQLMNAPQHSGSSFGALASIAGMDGQHNRAWAWLILALLIDGCAVIAWTILTDDVSGRPDNGTETVRNVPERSGMMVSVTRTDSTTETTSVQFEQLDREHFETIRKRLLAGQYGNNPSIRGVMKAESIGYPKAAEAFSILEDERLIVRAAKGYRLIE